MPQTAINVVTNPSGFFRECQNGRLSGTTCFCRHHGGGGLSVGIIQAILSFIGLGAAGCGMSGFGMILFMPDYAAIGSFIGAAILFVIWKLMGSQENYETAYRCGLT